MVGIKLKPLLYTGIGYLGLSFGYAYTKRFYALRDRPPKYQDTPIPVSSDRHENILMKSARIALYLPISLFSKVLMHTANSITVYNSEQLLKALKREENQGLVTVSNHQTTIDIILAGCNSLKFRDLLFPSRYPYVMNAEEYAFKNKFRAYWASIIRLMPIRRGEGIYQIEMDDFINRVRGGNWVQIYPEGRTYQNGPYSDRAADGCYYTPSGRKSPPNRNLGPLKWGVGRLIAECEVTPIILPFYQLGFEYIQPQVEDRVCKQTLPVGGNHTTVVYGEPIHVDDLLSHYRPLIEKEDDPEKKKQLQLQLYKAITDRIDQKLEILEKECIIKDQIDRNQIKLAGRKY